MMLRLRESTTLSSAAQEFRRLTRRKKLDAYAAFTRMQRELLDLADAHVERVILELFAPRRDWHGSVAICKKQALRRLSQLFALSRIELHKGWYLEHGALTALKSKAVTRLVDKLCQEVRGEAVQLVDSFRIPDSCLAAPIAL